MEWGIATKVFEHLLGIFAGAIVGSPVPADGELMIAEHVHDTHLGNGHTEQVGTLGHAGTDKQSAIGTTHNGQFIAGGVALADEVFGCSDEVVEDILLLHLGTCHVPRLAILATTTQIDLSIDAALLEERNARG